MIGRIQGILLLKQPPHVLLDVNGLGYEITAPLSTCYQLPNIHSEVILYTHLIVREDGHYLYGFHSENERKLFRSLIKINGVGPKLALTILSSMAPAQFIQCISQKDITPLVNMPGIGRKTAERLLIELKDIAKDMTPDMTIDMLVTAPENPQVTDAIRALVALGYKPKQAEHTINQIKQSDMITNATSETLIRLALQKIAAGTAGI